MHKVVHSTATSVFPKRFVNGVESCLGDGKEREDISLALNLQVRKIPLFEKNVVI